MYVYRLYPTYCQTSSTTFIIGQVLTTEQLLILFVWWPILSIVVTLMVVYVILAPW